MQNITQEQFIKLVAQDDTVIVDVRTPEEIAKGKIANALEINFLDSPEFLSEIQKLDKSNKHLFVCRSGNRSGKACLIMDDLGYKDNYNLIGGMLDWTGPTV